MRIPDDRLAELQALYDKGLCLTAYRAAAPYGPFQTWEGTRARILAGRLVSNLGDPRLASSLLLRAHRADPSDARAIYFGILARLQIRGPLDAFERLQRLPHDLPAEPRTASDLHTLRSRVASSFRDFDAAEDFVRRAEEACPSRAWVGVERSTLRLDEDRYDEALEEVDRALAIRPWYRPAVLLKAHLLQLLERDADALALLLEGAERLESAPLLSELARVQSDLFDYAGARQTWERFRESAPLLPKEGAAFLASRLADSSYFAGDLAGAAAHARLVDAPLYTTFAERIEALTGASARPSLPRRVLLRVPFVRQHHVTCAPATFAALSRYFGKAVDHLSIADSICYDGTPSHDGRSWAESNGFVVRELTVTWESAQALLDRGLPFALATVGPTNAHLQAVIGYDACRRSLFLRDPYVRPLRELLADESLKAQAASGPVGMVLVPREEAARLSGIDLPDAPLYDLLYRMQLALARHDRPAAGDAAREVARWPPGTG